MRVACLGRLTRVRVHMERCRVRECIKFKYSWNCLKEIRDTLLSSRAKLQHYYRTNYTHFYAPKVNSIEQINPLQPVICIKLHTGFFMNCKMYIFRDGTLDKKYFYWVRTDIAHLFSPNSNNSHDHPLSLSHYQTFHNQMMI